MKINVAENKQEIKNLLRRINREGIEDLIKALEQSDFFIAPASTIYHLNCKGGLAYHSLSVCKTLKRLSDEFAIDIPIESIIIVGLLHDVCKVNIYQFNSSNEKYKKKWNAPKKHGLRSIKMIEKYITLTDKERLMIRWHMGHYTWDGNFKNEEDKLKKFCPEAYLAYFADHISTLFLEEI